ncbi:pyruvate phosphate dikinase-like enzyme [Streptomyces sp. 1114.5]|uniref:PEP/pyruvate-binding domain-containing protein n=1 Tax=Streptomyces sp. 1114.5 TaxID=1938830 RepID=UPI000EAFC556|nr:PEP/pyruvate-binding domain-containing protein [Streptomyces sp. 1114.5]RKT19330.1 pyruvate phosphate dikinase-like enzyme [Streptomyces sp. 1114.5]
MRLTRSDRNEATTRPRLTGEKLTTREFRGLAGTVGGYPYVKIVLDRTESVLHFIDSADGTLHVRYIACEILGMSIDELARGLDSFNDDVYRNPDRRFCLGTLALHDRRGSAFLSLETVDVDTMSQDMLRAFYHRVRAHIDPALPLLLKPANHRQEAYVAGIPESEIPRVLSHELYSTASFVPLNAGEAHGRLRVFRSEAEYRADPEPLEWHDIVVMPRVPEDVPRVSGIIHTEHTTPLSHINVMAAGWRIPNAVGIDAVDRIERAGLAGRWVHYRVDADGSDLHLEAAPPRTEGAAPTPPAERVTVDRPDRTPTPVTALSDLRAGDHVRFGTKAANLGELTHLLQQGSPRWLGFYRVPRPPRADLLRYLARQLGLPEHADEAELDTAAQRLVKEHAHVPRGIVLPFSLQQRFLDSSAELREALDRLDSALLNGTSGPSTGTAGTGADAAAAAQLEELCRAAQQLIRATPLPDPIRTEIDRALDRHLYGAPLVVVRSSSNAEDLPGFSAAGLYESVANVSGPDAVLAAVREVWASLLSPRAVLLRQQAGIPLDHCGMGVIVQEQVGAAVGGVLVTCNPLSPQDFRDVYVNISPRSVTEVVTGQGAPLQYLCNTMEGGSRTVSLGTDGTDLDPATKDLVGRLALISRLLQSHFSPDESYADPVDIEWAIEGDRIDLLQLRPFRTAAR